MSDAPKCSWCPYRAGCCPECEEYEREREMAELMKAPDGWNAHAASRHAPKEEDLQTYCDLRRRYAEDLERS